MNESTHYDLAMKYVNFWISQDGQVLLAKFEFGSTFPTTTTSTRDTAFQLQMTREENGQTVLTIAAGAEAIGKISWPVENCTVRHY